MELSRVRKRVTAAFLTTTAIAASLVVAEPAAAADRPLVFQKHGSDVGELWAGNYNAAGRVVICDNEADGRGVYIQLQNEAGETLSWTDSSGSNGVCVTAGSYFVINFIEWMRVCERINNLPDNCTDKISIRYGD
ncbi:hypothetical protein QA802_40805 [Streptomyces sp. B21-105]|uniref:hypothetical protein n=1 Tax=Streptomyces sp. B21-105 TaxID=3039417 RepID=UPI002FEFE171